MWPRAYCSTAPESTCTGTWSSLHRRLHFVLRATRKSMKNSTITQYNDRRHHSCRLPAAVQCRSYSSTCDVDMPPIGRGSKSLLYLEYHVCTSWATSWWDSTRLKPCGSVLPSSTADSAHANHYLPALHIPVTNLCLSYVHKKNACTAVAGCGGQETDPNSSIFTTCSSSNFAPCSVVQE